METKRSDFDARVTRLQTSNIERKDERLAMRKEIPPSLIAGRTLGGTELSLLMYPVQSNSARTAMRFDALKPGSRPCATITRRATRLRETGLPNHERAAARNQCFGDGRYLQRIHRVAGPKLGVEPLPGCCLRPGKMRFGNVHCPASSRG